MREVSSRHFHSLPQFGDSSWVQPCQFMCSTNWSTPREYLNFLIKTHSYFEPVSANYFLNRFKRLNEEKIGFKFAKENPFGISNSTIISAINSEQFPYESSGEYFYPKKYFKLKASVEHQQLINDQAAQYLKAAMERANQPTHATH